jgi:hypothetical protein
MGKQIAAESQKVIVYSVPCSPPRPLFFSFSPFPPAVQATRPERCCGSASVSQESRARSDWFRIGRRADSIRKGAGKEGCDA